MLPTLALFASMAVTSLYTADTESILLPPIVAESDKVQIVLDGWKRASCDETLPAKVSIAEREHIVMIGIRARAPGEICVPVMTRFTSAVDLGSLSLGHWRIVVNDGLLETGLDVGEAAGARGDEALRVFGVEVEDAAGGGWNAVISGELLNSCAKLAEARVTVGARAFDIAPITSQANADDCVDGSFAFTERVALPEPNLAGRYLVQVQNHDGGAVSDVFSVGEGELAGQ